MPRPAVARALTLSFTLLAAGAAAQTPPPPPPPGPGGASEEVNPLGWTAKAALSYVQTTGNSKSSNLGFRFNASYNWTKTFWLLFYDNLPALEEIDIFAGQAGGLPIPPAVGTALVPLKKWDNQFAVSLVVNIFPKKP